MEVKSDAFDVECGRTVLLNGCLHVQIVIGWPLIYIPQYRCDTLTVDQ
jgi:hypothetical protein